jgi:hypothetical protein
LSAGLRIAELQRRLAALDLRDEGDRDLAGAASRDLVVLSVYASSNSSCCERTAEIALDCAQTVVRLELAPRRRLVRGRPYVQRLDDCVVQAVLDRERSDATAAQELGVHRSSIWRWRKRARKTSI